MAALKVIIGQEQAAGSLEARQQGDMALRVVQFHLSHVMQAMQRQGGQVDSATLLAILQGAENTLHWAASSGVAMDPTALSDCSNRVRSLS